MRRIEQAPFTNNPKLWVVKEEGKRQVTMRGTLFSTALALTALASAQRTTGMNEINVQQAMETLRTVNPLILELRGEDVTGAGTSQKKTPIHAILYYRLSNDPRTGADSKAEVQLDVFQATTAGEALTLRIVGDGVTLRRYDFPRREVSSSVYGFYGPSKPANYPGSDAPKLLAQLQSVTPGPAAYLARLLRDLMPAGADYSATFSTWMPGYASSTLLDIPPTLVGGRRNINDAEVAIDDTVVDPISGVTYVEGNGWVTYGVDLPNPLRTLAFEFDASTTGTGTTLKTVYFASRTPDGHQAFAILPNPATLALPSDAFRPLTGTLGAQFRPVGRPGVGGY